jgi:hypothetical protein
MSFCPGTYYTHIIDHIPNNPFQSTLDRLKAFGLDFAFGIETDFNCPGHGTGIRDMMFRSGSVSTYFAESDLNLLERPYFALALMDFSDVYVAGLIAHWNSPSNHQPTRVVVDFIRAPERCIPILLDVIETMLKYLWLTEEEDEIFSDLKHLESVEMIISMASLSSESKSTLEEMGFSDSVEDCEERLVKNIFFRDLNKLSD